MAQTSTNSTSSILREEPLRRVMVLPARSRIEVPASDLQMVRHHPEHVKILTEPLLNVL